MTPDAPLPGVPLLPLAACSVSLEPDIWHADPNTADADEAKRICAFCPERVACLQWALDHGERFGIWGGLTPTQRHRLVNPTWQQRQRTPEGTFA